MRLASFLILSLALATPAAADVVNIALDGNARIALSRPARDVVIGNPAVADVTLTDARSIVVLGKGFGSTNLLVTDKNGRTIVNHEIVVTSPDVGAVSVFRGASGQTFACAARCEPAANKAYAAPEKTQP